MKANKILAITVFSLLSIQAMSPTDFLASVHKTNGRMPASAEASKKTLSKKQEKFLKDKLASLKEDQILSESLLVDYKAEPKSEEFDRKIEKFTQLIAQQKIDIADVEDKLKDAEIVADETGPCKPELKGEQLVADVNKEVENTGIVRVLKETNSIKELSLDDLAKPDNKALDEALASLPEVKVELTQTRPVKDLPYSIKEIKAEDLAKPDNKELDESLARLPEVKVELTQTRPVKNLPYSIKEIKAEDLPKFDNKALKESLEKLPEIKVAEVKPKKTKKKLEEESEEAEDKAEVKSETKKEKKQKPESSTVVELMSQMTSSFTQAMQNQAALQAQMLSMIAQMQANMVPQPNREFDYRASTYSYPLTLSERLERESLHVGYHPAYYAPYSNPYPSVPMYQQPVQQEQQAPQQYSGFTFQAPLKFDFSQAGVVPAAAQPIQAQPTLIRTILSSN